MRLEAEALTDRRLAAAADLAAARAEVGRWIGTAALAELPADALERVPLPEPPLAPGLVAAAATGGSGASAAGAGAGNGSNPAGNEPGAAVAGEAGRRRLAAHPALAVLAADEGVAEVDVGLARAAYRPDWALELGYGVRDDLTPAGDRPDFVSAAVTLELPVFTARRQDRRLAAARGEREAARADRLDRLRELEATWRAASARLRRQRERLALYEERILPQAGQTAEAARRGYRADAGDFPEVVRAVFAELDARIRRDGIAAEALQTQARLLFLTGPEPQDEPQEETP